MYTCYTYTAGPLAPLFLLFVAGAVCALFMALSLPVGTGTHSSWPALELTRGEQPQPTVDVGGQTPQPPGTPGEQL